MAFWGLVLEPKKQYSQVVEQPFHISMAAIDLTSSDAGEEASSVVLRRDGGDFILCNLSKKHRLLNVQLNLDFEVGDEINFYVSGNSNIHLTGFVADDSMEGFSDESGEEEEEESEGAERSPILKATKKLLDKADKRKADNIKGNAAKKAKVAEEEDESDSELDWNVDDSDEDQEEEEGEEIDEDEDEDTDDSEDPEELLKQFAAAKKQDKQGQKPKQTGKQENQPQGKGKPNKEKQKPQQQQQQQQQKGANVNKQDKQANENAKANGVLKKSNISGILIEELRSGNGPVAKPGKMVTVYFVGRLKSNNHQFDAAQKGPGFQFRLGRGEVIKGWDIGLNGMQVGSKRRITIPPKLAYGSQGAPPSIPPNSALVFEVEMKGVR